MIDRFTRWSEAIPLQDYTADTAEDIFYSLDSQRFGAPCLITSDYWLGSQFEAQLFDALIKLGNSKRCRTTAYHPESNGIIKRKNITCEENKAVREYKVGDYVEIKNVETKPGKFF